MSADNGVYIARKDGQYSVRYLTSFYADDYSHDELIKIFFDETHFYDIFDSIEDAQREAERIVLDMLNEGYFIEHGILQLNLD